MSDFFDCPNCGAEVPIKAKSCPDCGSDEKTGWSEDTMYDGLDLPALEESDTQEKASMLQSKILYYIVVILTIVAFILFYTL
ncbi:MAG: zinc ribbon domain-containing protein [Candidatus Scalindua sp.]|nr:zinc ribbon domain-containing protein [Candidatus Scalindua sp.]MCR4345200.1 zinc ribbon domain-containing protein [Candidatus Scalindua sp.]